MSRRHIVYIAMALGLMIGNSFLFGSWFFPAKELDAQCTQFFLDSAATDPPPCTGGTYVSSTLGADAAYGGTTNYVALCLR